MRGEREFSAEAKMKMLRSEVNDHVSRLSHSLADLRASLGNAQLQLDEEATNASSLANCLAESDGHIMRIYDTMIRVRWAALSAQRSLTDNRASIQRDHTVCETESTVYIVDDNTSVRKALTRLFRSMDYTVQTFSSAQEFLTNGPTCYPACVVLDVRMPRMSGLDLQQELASQASDLPIIFITGHGDIDMAVQAMKDGAVDFLPKPFDDQDLIDSVDRALQKHREIRAANKARLEVEKKLAMLTRREREVFERVVKGMLNKQIGFELGTTEKTIKVHRGRVMEKMGTKALADLVRMASCVGIEGPAQGE